MAVVGKVLLRQKIIIRVGRNNTKKKTKTQNTK